MEKLISVLGGGAVLLAYIALLVLGCWVLALAIGCVYDKIRG